MSKSPFTEALPMASASSALDLAERENGAFRRTTAGHISWDGERLPVHRYRLLGPEAGHDTLRLGLFAGLHGDEPAGTDSLLRLADSFLEDPEPFRGYELLLYPAVNPVGLRLGTRENGRGKDLNREFWKGSDEEEVRIVERELRGNRLDGIVTLHADDTCEGVYGYAHGRTLDEALLKPALEAAERFLPRDRRRFIDGFAASDSLIRDCYDGVLGAPPDQKPQPFNLIVETPARADHALQVAAGAAAVASVLGSYRRFISYAAYL